MNSENFQFETQLEDTARYGGLLLAPAEGFGLRPRAFFALRAKKQIIMLFGKFNVILVSSSTLSNFQRNTKSPKKIKQKIEKIKIRKIPKNSGKKKLKNSKKYKKKTIGKIYERP